MSDMISRCELFNSLATIQADTANEMKGKIYEIIQSAPTIDADRPKGEWLPFEYGDDTWHKCSVCGIADKYKGSMPRPNGEVGEWEYVRNFCPNCGADMRGEDDE